MKKIKNVLPDEIDYSEGLPTPDHVSREDDAGEIKHYVDKNDKGKTKGIREVKKHSRKT